MKKPCQRFFTFVKIFKNMTFQNIQPRFYSFCNNLLIIAISTLVLITSCNPTKQKQTIDSTAEKLYTQGTKLLMSAPDDKDTLHKALLLMDSALQIQPDYKGAYWNKLAILRGLGEKKQYLNTLKKLEGLNLNPIELPYIKDVIGITMERQGMDSIAARKKFMEADSLYQIILDTLTKKSKAFWTIQEQRAINLTLLNKEKQKKELLTRLKGVAKKDSNLLHTRMINALSNQTKKEIIGKKDSL